MPAEGMRGFPLKIKHISAANAALFVLFHVVEEFPEEIVSDQNIRIEPKNILPRGARQSEIERPGRSEIASRLNVDEPVLKKFTKPFPRPVRRSVVYKNDLVT